MTRLDTDSLFIKCEQFLLNQGISKEAWDKIPSEEKTAYILELSKIVETYVDTCTYEETQRGDFNSQVVREEFSIGFKQEIIAKSMLFVAKKKYGFHVVNKDGIPTDKIDVTGLEIIRSETPSVFKVALKDMLGMILRNKPDADIVTAYNKYKKDAKSVYPEEISENKGVKNLDKYIVDGECVKGTPYHVRAVANYHKLLKELKIDDKYPSIEDGSKNKLIYVRPNRWGMETIMYDRWPSEFDAVGVVPDKEKMIEKFLNNKVIMLLQPMKKEYILDANAGFDLFFG